MIDTATLASSIKFALDKAELNPSPTAKEELANDIATAIGVFASKLQVELFYPGNVNLSTGSATGTLTVTIPALGAPTPVPVIPPLNVQQLSFSASTTVI